jgi:hypothetical protein
MDQLRDFLEAVKDSGMAGGHFRGLLFVLIGQTIRAEDGTVISAGMSWRAAAALLKLVRWDRLAVQDLGLDPATLAPRDREKYWYTAISRANLGSAEAKASGEALARAVAALGYTVGTPPAGEGPSA